MKKRTQSTQPDSLSVDGQPSTANPPRIPLFPLNAVLFPQGPLKLRIFEARYVDMIGRCMREGTPFGVALIVEGVEAGGEAHTVSVGTSARVVDFEKLQDGLLGITALGERSFSIRSVERQPDGLNIATIDWLPGEPSLPVPPECNYLVRLLQHALPQLAPVYDFTPIRYEDAAWVSARVVEILPLPLAEKQRCLEMQDPLGRLEHLRMRVRVEAVEQEEDLQ